ncbi:MAG: hypothetical protein H0U53_00520 [Actinobacteria bacterium]|nr:hypothetical protein [Actinomycetota bacterium]
MKIEIIRTLERETPWPLQVGGFVVSRLLSRRIYLSPRGWAGAISGDEVDLLVEAKLKAEDLLDHHKLT